MQFDFSQFPTDMFTLHNSSAALNQHNHIAIKKNLVVHNDVKKDFSFEEIKKIYKDCQ